MNASKAILCVIFVAITGVTPCLGQTSESSPPATPSAPPSAPPKPSEADLEKLVAPIALYPDPLLATLLPASAYPLEIVQAARFIKDTNNISKVDSQSWDSNVKALARFPDVIAKMNEDIGWTSDLGQAFAEDQKSVLDAIQTMRAKAQQVGNLKTTPQQVVVVTNTVVEKTVEQKVVVVTNTVVEIQPAQPEVIYVPTYNPTVVYAPPPAGAVVAASVISFGVGMAVGAVIANNCNWHSGGIYVGPHGGVAWGGGYHGDVNVNVNRNVNVNQNINANRNINQNANVNRSANVGANANRSSGQQWHPDNTRRTSTPSYASAQSRGYGSGGGSSSLGASRSPSSFGGGGSSALGGESHGASSFGGGGASHSAFNNYGGAAQTRQASSRGASSFGGGHGRGGRRR
jgi:hypothetical protein